LYDATGVAAVNYTDVLETRTIEDLLMIFRSGLPPGARHALHRLRFVYAYSSKGLSRRNIQARYVASLDTINVPGRTAVRGRSGQRPAAERLALLAHEIGHSLAFSQMTPETLADLATKEGPWPPFDSSVQSLLDPVFFEEHPLRNTTAGLPGRTKNTPSTYALAGIHEWFAECTAETIMLSLRANGALRETSRKSRPALSPSLRATIWRRLGCERDCEQSSP
jgi:hypothetical protein